jgi:Domain of unknown function (DUF4124)
MRTLSLALILATASAGAAAQAYRWVDEKGKVHYGDRPPTTANASVPGTRSAKPRTGEPVTPGMKPEEVLEVFGKPDHVRKVASAAGEAQYWTYRKPKGQSSSYTVKFEHGAVTEVSSEESTAGAPAPKAPAAVPSPGTATAAAGSDPAERQVQADAERRARECASARDRLRGADDAARRGGPAQTMDRLREDRRRHEQRLSELGC